MVLYNDQFIISRKSNGGNWFVNYQALVITRNDGNYFCMMISCIMRPRNFRDRRFFFFFVYFFFFFIRHRKICRKVRRPCPSLRGGFQNYSQAGARSDEFVDPLEPANPVGRQELLRSATIHLLSSSLGEPSVASDCLKNFPRMYCDFRTWNFCLPESRRKGEAVHRRTILDGVVAEFLGEIPEGKRIQNGVKRKHLLLNVNVSSNLDSRLSIIRLLSNVK